MSVAERADTLERFLLRGAPVRGEAVSLDTSWREVSERHAFPRSVRERLGELCAAGLLLSASLKFDGALILQIHGDGPVALLVVECGSDGGFRATAKLRDGEPCPEEADLATLVNAHGRGRFVVTLDPRTDSPNRRPYQGIVPFEGNTVAEVLERYMARSEQVPTRLWLAADEHRAAGLLLQRLPDEGGRPPAWAPGPADDGTAAAALASAAEPDDDGWNRLQRLADTVTRGELLSLPLATVLRRLFWQEPLHGFDSRAPRFECSCSRDKVIAMLRMLGRNEIDAIVAERDAVEVQCEYCATPYRFDAVDAARLFVSGPSVPGSSSHH